MIEVEVESAELYLLDLNLDPDGDVGRSGSDDATAAMTTVAR